MCYPLLLKPYISELVWGGTRLLTQYHMETEKRNAAEAWVLSCQPGAENRIQNGAFAGELLSDVLQKHPEFEGEHAARFAQFPILIKLIDARDDLSIQVHPDDAYCAKVGRDAGKTECWYILDCEEDAHLILGFRENLTREELESAVASDTLLDCVQKVPLKKGDFFFIEAGTLHAICKGVLLAEVQQNSNTTYRVYDYNRPGLDGKPRELHVADALEVIRREPYSPSIYAQAAEEKAAYTQRRLASCPFFSTQTVDIRQQYESFADAQSFVSLLVLEGQGEILCGGEQLAIAKGQSLFLPAGCGAFTVQGRLQILETRI